MSKELVGQEVSALNVQSQNPNLSVNAGERLVPILCRTGRERY